jgi:hypothetical protein
MNNRFRFGPVTVVLIALLAYALVMSRITRAQQAPESKPLSGQVKVTGSGFGVKGYVIDSACTFTKQLKKPISPDCAIACAKAGSPLVIQTADGVIYWPISSDTPASGQNDKLMSYAGKMVTVTGKIYTKGGSHAIVIEKIETAQ